MENPHMSPTGERRASPGFRFRWFFWGRGFQCESAGFKGRARFWFRFRFLKNGADGCSSNFCSRKNGSDGSGFWFQFGSSAVLRLQYSESWYVYIFETRCESNFVCPTKVLSWMCLSEEVTWEIWPNAHQRDQNINRANLCENEIV